MLNEPGGSAAGGARQRLRRIFSWLSHLGLVLAAPVAAIGLAAGYAVHVDSLGAHDLGLAISFAVISTFALFGGLCAAPVFLILGAAAFSIHRPAAYRFLAAAAVCAFPLATLR